MTAPLVDDVTELLAELCVPCEFPDPSCDSPAGWIARAVWDCACGPQVLLFCTGHLERLLRLARKIELAWQQHRGLVWDCSVCGGVATHLHVSFEPITPP